MSGVLSTDNLRLFL